MFIAVNSNTNKIVAWSENKDKIERLVSEGNRLHQETLNYFNKEKEFNKNYPPFTFSMQKPTKPVGPHKINVDSEEFKEYERQKAEYNKILAYYYEKFREQQSEYFRNKSTQKILEIGHPPVLTFDQLRIEEITHLKV